MKLAWKKDGAKLLRMLAVWTVSLGLATGAHADVHAPIKLTAPTEFPTMFGQGAVMDDDTLLISSFDFPGGSKVFSYDRVETGGWQLNTTLQGREFKGFLQSAALSGATLLAATNLANSPYLDAVNVFREQGDGAWTLGATLTGSDNLPGSLFGASVAIDGNLALVGAPGGPPSRGAAYVFRENGGQFHEVAKLTPNETLPHGSFGSSIAVAGETIVVSGSNAHATAYVFKPGEGGTWTQHAALVPSDDQSFIYSDGRVAIHDDTIIVGAPQHSNAGKTQGAAYIYREDDAGHWTELAELSVNESLGGGAFGSSVAIGDGWAVVGSPGDDAADGHGVDSGMAFVFREDALGAWRLTYTLAAADGKPGDGFGRAVAANGKTIVVGAPFHDLSIRTEGAAYVFVVPEPSSSLAPGLVALVGLSRNKFRRRHAWPQVAVRR
jgi:hypothetical protein